MYATTGLNVGVSGLLHQSGTIVHSTEAAWGEFPGNAQNSLNLLTGRTTDANFTSLEMNNGMYSGLNYLLIKHSLLMLILQAVEQMAMKQ